MLRTVVRGSAERRRARPQRQLAPNGTYTAKINGVLVRSDGVHPTPNAVKWMTPWLVDAVSCGA